METTRETTQTGNKSKNRNVRKERKQHRQNNTNTSSKTTRKKQQHPKGRKNYKRSTADIKHINKVKNKRLKNTSIKKDRQKQTKQ